MNHYFFRNQITAITMIRTTPTPPTIKVRVRTSNPVGTGVVSDVVSDVVPVVGPVVVSVVVSVVVPVVVGANPPGV